MSNRPGILTETFRITVKLKSWKLSCSYSHPEGTVLRSWFITQRNGFLMVMRVNDLVMLHRAHRKLLLCPSTS